MLPNTFSKDETEIWVKKYPQLVKELKDDVQKKYNFIDINDRSNHYHQCELGLNSFYIHTDGNGLEKKKPFVMIGFGKEGGFTSLTIVIQIILIKSKIKHIKNFFGRVKEVVDFESDFIHIYPLHITPLGVNDETKYGSTFTYKMKKTPWLKQNIDWFKTTYLNKKYRFEFSIDINQLLDEISEKISIFYDTVVKMEFEKSKSEFDNSKKISITILDKDGDGEIDLVDGDSFNKLLIKNQKSIIERNENYIQKFVKISMYLKTKKNNTQKIFESIKDTTSDSELNELVNLLKNQIHTYELLVFHSINMITSLVENNLIIFYEIYECFDQLGVFNSNWENEVSNKLTNIGEGIKDLMYSIYEMENKIVDSIENLTYITQESFNDLQTSISRDLQDIESSIQVNNLLTGIQTYQMYKINKNTKRINYM